MSNSQPRRGNGVFGKRSKERRPTGVSRRRKKQLGFESLETRQVMSGTPIVTPPMMFQSLSSSTAEGEAAVWLRELAWAAQQNAAMQGNVVNVVESIPTDPYLGQQWHLINTGQQVGNPDYQYIFGVPGEDINVAPVWDQGITGAGVVVGVVDSGVVMNHPDLAANISPTLRLDAINFDGDPSPVWSTFVNAHGTSVAGIIGAVANNGVGGVGVAPGVQIAPIRLIDAGATTEGFVAMMQYGLVNGIDVFNHSWGSGQGRQTADNISPFELQALRDNIMFGRNGLGIIHVKSAGNSGGPAQPDGFTSLGLQSSSSFEAWDNLRYVIIVGAVDHDGFYNNFDGTVTAYPESGPNVLVAAPTGSNAPGNEITSDTGLGSGILTTDGLGDLGFNESADPDTGFEFDRDFFNDPDYTSRFNGTSAAAPQVTGVVALMLEANPNLSWRDVQEILVRSARQNAQFEVPTNGAGQGLGFGTQNIWYTNQMPLFQDPDPYDPTVPVGTQIDNPSVLGTPYVMTNGAGYTVSLGKGIYGEQVGTGHGVVDAGMAVELAKQWTVKNQTLPRELTFTTFVTTAAVPLPAAEKSSDETGRRLVPGAMGGDPGFIAYWEEYYADLPFSGDDPPQNTRGSGVQYSVPASNAMTVEHVEVKISMSGSGAALDHVRVILTSPNGTQSDLSHFFVDPGFIPFSLQNRTPYTFAGDPGGDLGPDAFVWTFSTNRIWGERSDEDLVFDPLTMEPALDGALQQGWKLDIENYSGSAFTINGVEIAWHGSPINPASKRVQGVVGVDDNRDDIFNYTRLITQIVDSDGDPSTDRQADVISTADLAQESFAGNVTVSVRRASDNVLVDQFVTGHDGNFYFDLVPDEYIISVEDPLGRVAQDDSITGSGFLSHYKSEWRITPEWFQAWDHDPTNIAEVLVDGDGDPVPFAATAGQDYHIRGINFLLDPGPAAPQEVQFTGTVYADVNGDGVFNGNDVALSNVSIYADVNRNGQRDPGETQVITDASGQYTLVAPVSAASVMNVGVVAPTQWTVTNPTALVHSRLVKPGAAFTNLNFFLDPPADNIGGGGASQPGFLLGVAYNDINNNGQRDAGELGVPGFTVFIDANNNGVVDAGDTTTVTNQFGAYAFSNVAPGQRAVRVVTPSPFTQTSPAGNAARVVNLTGSSTISNLLFGIRDTAVLDYGDLPAVYGMTTSAQNGARHRKGVYYLGDRIDGELNGNPSANADGDDLFGLDDEDGIVFGTLAAGGTTQLTVTASRNNGYLKGWVDWNNDGVFGEGERLTFTLNGQTSDNALLSAGSNSLFINVPAGVNPSDVFARFRYGEFGLNSPWGEAVIGEVEDYKITVVPPVGSIVAGIPADFNQSGAVDGFDFLTWQRNYGRTSLVTQANGNANGDTSVNASDLLIWKQQFGTVSQSTSAVAALMAAEEVEEPLAPLSSSVVIDGALATRLADAAKGVDREKLAARLREIAEKIDNRFEAIGDKAVEVLNRVADRVEDAAGKDGALSQLIGSRRRPSFRPALEVVDAAEADEAFAALGNGLL